MEVRQVLFNGTGDIPQIGLGGIMQQGIELICLRHILRHMHTVLSHGVETQTVAIESAQQRQGMGDVFDMNGFEIRLQRIEQIALIGLYGQGVFLKSY